MSIKELYLKDKGINVEEQRIVINVAMPSLMIVLMRLGIDTKLVPEVLRITANSVDIMTQNSDRENKPK